MNAGPNGPQHLVEQVGSEPTGGPGRRGRDQRMGLVLAGIAAAALLVAGLIALVLTMAD
ncbi:hypothetical protein LJR027_004022 [Terrabacter sp. LjRoot27]|jgi:hypothetical protein|uniref:hypothetical protein n=1 Tax=Terrabacter sp. LjRoot27 TaxID=3342306 RepID=UPI003ECD2ABB